MTIDRNAIAASLAAKMEAVSAARRAARIADAEREMQLRDQFIDFWETVELLNQQGLESHGGLLQFSGEAWDAGAGVITGALELRGPGGEHQIAYRAQGDALQVDWSGGAPVRYKATDLAAAIDKLTDVVAAAFAKPE
jgi:hypothetical protein